jgi:arginyl-tRNA synthetase
MLDEIKEDAVKVLHAACEGRADKGQIAQTLEVAREGFGDLASKLAFALAPIEKKSPVEIARNIASKAPKSKFFSNIEAVGPYINLRMSDYAYSFALKKILKEGKKFGKGKKTGKEMMVEYFHANTHKGVHIGHIRNVSLGESVCRLLEFDGNKVYRANYQGDIGPHVAKCLWGFLNLHNGKAPEGKRGIWLGKVYSEASKKIEGNEDLERQVQDINMKLYSKDREMTAIWKETRQWCLDDFKLFYKEFGVKFDEFYFESQTQEPGMEIAKDALKKGIAKLDQGAVIIDMKKEDLGVGIIITKEGYPLYHTKDLGLAKLKFGKYKDLDRSIHVVGKEQEFYFKQLFKMFERIGFEKAARISYHLIYELVMLPEGKMSSREGTMVLYEDLKEKLLSLVKEEVRKRHTDWDEKKVSETAIEITLAAIKFTMIRREPNKQLIFDWDQALSLEGDSGPYLQYAYVRTNGILRKAEFKPDVSEGYAFTEHEKTLIKLLSQFPATTSSAASTLSPHVLCGYLLELAAELNRFYTTSRVLNAEKEDERESRLAMIAATNTVLEGGLGLLGIGTPERM